MSARREMIRLASTMNVGDPRRRELLRLAKDMAKTPEGAKHLFDEYKRQHPGTKKRPKDFYDPKGGEEEVGDYWSGQGQSEREKKEKSKTKREKGEESTKERTKEKKEEYRDKKKPHSPFDANRMDENRKSVTKGRERGSAWLKDKDPKQVERKVNSIYRKLDLDPKDSKSLEKALRTVKHNIKDTDYNSGYREKYLRNNMEWDEVGEAQAILSKWKKLQGNKGKKASHRFASTLRRILASEGMVQSKEGAKISVEAADQDKLTRALQAEAKIIAERVGHLNRQLGDLSKITKYGPPEKQDVEHWMMIQDGIEVTASLLTDISGKLSSTVSQLSRER